MSSKVSWLRPAEQKALQTEVIRWKTWVFWELYDQLFWSIFAHTVDKNWINTYTVRSQVQNEAKNKRICTSEQAHERWLTCSPDKHNSIFKVWISHLMCFLQVQY